MPPLRGSLSDNWTVIYKHPAPTELRLSELLLILFWGALLRAAFGAGLFRQHLFRRLLFRFGLLRGRPFFRRGRSRRVVMVKPIKRVHCPIPDALVRDFEPDGR